MKNLLFVLAVLVASSAGYALLAATCVAAFLSTQIGAHNVRNGNLRGKIDIKNGVLIGALTLFGALFKLIIVVGEMTLH